MLWLRKQQINDYSHSTIHQRYDREDLMNMQSVQHLDDIQKSFHAVQIYQIPTGIKHKNSVYNIPCSCDRVYKDETSHLTKSNVDTLKADLPGHVSVENSVH